MKTKMKTKKTKTHGFDWDAQRLKTQRRLPERRWIKSKQHNDLIEYKHINTIYKTPVSLQEKTYTKQIK